MSYRFPSTPTESCRGSIMPILSYRAHATVSLFCFHQRSPLLLAKYEYCTSSVLSTALASREFPRGLIPPTFEQHPPASGKKKGERGRGGREKGKGREEGKGRDPQGLVDTPMFQILTNTLLARFRSNVTTVHDLH